MSVSDLAKDATFEEKVQALIRQGHSRESAEAIAASTCKSLHLKIAKANSEKQIALAVTNVVTEADGTPVVDHQGDVIEIGNLEDQFIEAFGSGGVGKSGTMHERQGGADVVQYFTFSREEWKALEPYIGKEIGIVKLRVTDPRIWAGVKNGSYPEVSIGGEGTREPI